MYQIRLNYEFANESDNSILQQSTEIRSVERGICPVAETLTDTIIFQRPCAKLPYMYRVAHMYTWPKNWHHFLYALT